MTATTKEPRARPSDRIRRYVDLLQSVRDRLLTSLSPTMNVRWTVLAPLLGFSAFVLFAMLRPPFPSDSLAYFGWAESLGGNEVSHGTTRLGVLVPVRFAINLFGVSEFAYYVVPFLMSLMLIGSTYAIGVKLTGRQLVGLIAALTMVLSTLVLELTSQLLPDTFAAAWFALGIALVLSGRDSARRTVWLAAAALAVGIAYTCREYVVFMAPLVLFLAWLFSFTRAEWVVIAGVLAGVLVLEMTSMAVLFENPFARFQALAGFAERGASGESVLLAAYGEEATRWDVLARAPRTFTKYNVGKLLMLSVPAGLAMAVVDRRRRAVWVILCLWVASLWLPMMLLAGIIDPSRPRIRDNHIRYWFLILPTLYLLLSAVPTLAIERIRRKSFRIAVAAMVVAILVGSLAADLRSVPENSMFRAFGATQWDEVRDWLRAEGQSIDRIYIDRRLARVLPLYTREVFGDPIWRGEITMFETRGEFVPLADVDGALIMHELGLRYLRNRDLSVPDAYVNPGPSWVTAVRRADGTLTIISPASGESKVDAYLELVDKVAIEEIPTSNIRVTGDAVVERPGEITSVGTDPQIRLGSIARPEHRYLVASLDAPESTTAQLFWSESVNAFQDDRSLRAPVDGDAEYVVFDLSPIPPGSYLRFDPGEVAGIVVTDLFIAVTSAG